MPSVVLGIDPLTPAIGAEVTGVDLAQPLDPTTQDAISPKLCAKASWSRGVIA